MHLALYRKWRPLIFDDVIGQEHITGVLRYEVENNKVNHAYLFCGSRGTGKTTCAKILAKAVNCISPKNGNPCCKCEYCKAIENGTTTDVLEMDAASNTGVDYIRDIKDEVMYAPSLVKNRVYIIDEVHMLSDSAFNALLKTLEEPPDNVIFILATTERQKIPATILSRCQKFDFKRISSDNIASRLQFISDNEGIKIEPDAARFIAGLCNGGMRDSISMLELVCSDGKDKTVTAKKVASVAGVIGRDVCARTVRAVMDRNVKEILSIVANIYYSSYDISAFWNELMKYYRDLLVVSVFKNDKSDPSSEFLDLTNGEYQELKQLAEGMTYQTIIYQAGLLENAYITSIGKQGSDKRLSAEMVLLRMAEPSSTSSFEALSARMSKLEAKVASGGFSIREGQSASKEKPNTENVPASNPGDPAQSASQVDEKQDFAAKTDVTAPSAVEDKAEVDSSRQDEERTAVDGWEEILSVYRITDSASAPYLMGAEVYIDGESNLVIVLENSFAKTMLELSKADKALCNIAVDRGIFIDRVKLTVRSAKPRQAEFDFENN